MTTPAMTTPADTGASEETKNKTERLAFVDAFLWLIRIGAIVVITWGIYGNIVQAGNPGTLNSEGWRELVIAGVAQGFMYGMIALGYSMVYGVLGFINFAHGEVFMSGGMAGFFAANGLAAAGWWDSSRFVWAFLIVIAVAALTSTLVAVLVERFAYRPLRGAPRLIPLITSIGVSFFIQYSFAGMFGVGVRTYPQPPEWLRAKQSIFGLFDVGRIKLLVIVLAIISMVLLYLFVEFSKTGRSMRAVSEDKEIASLMGINVDRVIVTTFAVGGAMAGVAASLWAINFRGISFVTGFLPGIKAFTAAVLGGIGNLPGAMAGGILLGLFEGVGGNLILGGLDSFFGLFFVLLILALVTVVLLLKAATPARRKRARLSLIIVVGALMVTAVVEPLRSFGFSLTVPSIFQLKDVVAFSALVLVLVFKPTGLFGERLAVEDRG